MDALNGQVEAFVDDFTLREAPSRHEDSREDEADEWANEALIPQAAWESPGCFLTRATRVSLPSRSALACTRRSSPAASAITPEIFALSHRCLEKGRCESSSNSPHEKARHSQTTGATSPIPSSGG